MLMTEDRIDIRELGPGHYVAWRAHPMTVFFRQYLSDYADRLVADAVARWKDGKQDQQVEQFARGVVEALEQIAQCEWAAIQQFYGVEPEPENEESDGKPPTE